MQLCVSLPARTSNCVLWYLDTTHSYWYTPIYYSSGCTSASRIAHHSSAPLSPHVPVMPSHLSFSYPDGHSVPSTPSVIDILLVCCSTDSTFLVKTHPVAPLTELSCLFTRHHLPCARTTSPSCTRPCACLSGGTVKGGLSRPRCSASRPHARYTPLSHQS